MTDPTENRATAGRLRDCRVERRPTEAEARAAIEAWLDEYAPGYPDYSLCEDGDSGAAENKCGWAFWIAPADTTSYLKEDLSIEWYGTGWPGSFAYDEDTGTFHELPAPLQPKALPDMRGRS